MHTKIFEHEKAYLTFPNVFSIFFNCFAQQPGNGAAPNQPPPVLQPAENAQPPVPCSIVLNTYKGIQYIFNGNFSLKTCDAVGENVSTKTIVVYQGSVFSVVGKSTDCKLIIAFRDFKKSDPTDRLKYNMVHAQDQHQVQEQNFVPNPDQIKQAIADINPTNRQYFLLDLTDFAALCSPFASSNPFSITLGTFVEPFKFRPTKSIFTSNLSLGAAAYFNWRIDASDTFGFVVGISATSVTLDSLSTKGTVRTNTDRPAITPSLSLVYAYKGINFSFGSGIDYLNKTSTIEKSWVFNGKPWIGFGIGVNLFTAAATTSSTQQIANQK